MAELKPKRMLLFGPGYGHNVESRLNSLKDGSLFDVTFIAYQLDEAFRDKYPYIKYVPSQFVIKKSHPWCTLKSLWWLYKQVRRSGHYDVIYSLGMTDVMGVLIFLLAKKGTKKAFEIWSIHVLESAKRGKTIFNRIDRYMLKNADLVCQLWWSIRELFVKYFPEYEQKFLMYQLAYPDIYFTGERHEPESDFVKIFLSKIPREQIVCFWPRSFIPSNNHPLLLESLGIIKKNNPKLLDNFKLYLWGGNVEQESRIKLINEIVKHNNLQNNVEIVEHPFVSQNDIFAIEERSDFFVQIANDDILSTFIMEILCSGKPYVISNLRTFQFLNEKYDLDIDLVDNDENLIADRIEAILLDLREGNGIIDDSRRVKCNNYFSVANTIPSAQILYDTL